MVLLPDPVGPQQRNMPCGWVTISRIDWIILGRMPMSSNRPTAAALSRMRMTSFSPALEPEVATRKSISRPSNFAPKEPSWGFRFSEMSIAQRTFMMFTTASPVGRSKGSAACMMPSIRYRTES